MSKKASYPANRSHGLAVRLITLFSLVVFLSGLAVSQEKTKAEKAKSEKPTESKPTPRSADGHPDFNGFWNQVAATQFAQRAADGSILYEFSINFDETIEVCVDDSCQLPNQPPYKPEVMAKIKEIAATEYLGTSPLDPEMLCKPHGVPRTGVGGMQIVQTPKVTALLYEGAPSFVYRIIYTDGRPHPDDLETSFMGHSIGRWEGDTLVIDTVGFNELVAGFGVHSEKLHVVERWRRPDLGRLEVEITATDPEAWTGEYKFSFAASLIPNQEVLEFICAENNQDVNHWITDRAWRGRP